jgi:catechol 2,3-dioxygenase-like lactoylglutathione lyase family enzyme
MRMRQITPFVLCTTLEHQVGFYRDVLGFEVGVRDGNYAFLRRDDVAVRLLEIDQDTDLQGSERQGSFYVDVEDIDALYLSMAPRLGSLPPGRVRPPFDQDYGQREFHVIDEDGTLIFFGQPVEQERP